jgi:hypothetical protein
MNDNDPHPSTAFTAALGAEAIVVIGIIACITLAGHRIAPLLSNWWGG